MKHANVETIDDEEFFEFEHVESVFNKHSEEDIETLSHGEEVATCKFCWSHVTEDDNPLLSCCKCAGSVGYLHYRCLKQWLDNKKIMKEGENFTSIFWKSFECEICKKAYPLMIRSNEHNYHLVDYQRPQTSYLVLESLNQEKNTSRIVHIIKPT
jgi:hypothetical protein